MRLTPLVLVAAASTVSAATVTQVDAENAVKGLDGALIEKRGTPPVYGPYDVGSGDRTLLGDRKSLDVSVVVAVVQGRLQQLAVRSVADALAASGGPDGCRNYVRDMLSRAARLLLEANSSGVKRSDLVELALSAAHLAVTAGVVQVRYSDEAQLNGWVAALNQELAAAGRQPMACDEACAALKARLTERAWLELAELFGRSPESALTCSDDAVVAKVVDAKHSEWLGIAELKTGLLAVASMARRKTVEPQGLLAALRVVPDLSLGQAGLDAEQLKELVKSVEGPVGCLVAQLAALHKAGTALRQAIRDGNDPKVKADELVKLLENMKKADSVVSCRPDGYASGLFEVLNSNGEVEAMLKWSKTLVAGSTSFSEFSSAELNALLDRRDWDGAALKLREFVATRQLARQLAGSLKNVTTLSDLSLTQLGEVANLGLDIVGKLQHAEPVARRFKLDALADAMKVEVARLNGVQKLFAAVSEAGPESGSTAKKLGELVKQVLALQTGEGVPAILNVLQPVITELRAGKKLDEALVLKIIASLDADLLRSAFTKAQGCFPDSGALAWVFRVVASMQVAFVEADGKLVLNADRLVTTLAATGDTFRSTNQWHWFFHLTVGTGALWSYRSAEANDRTAPLIAEQIGFGLGSPSFLGDRVAVKFGLFGSGILYRIVLDNAESQAVMFGGFAAVDIYSLIEVYGAPLFLFYPPTSTAPSYGSFGFAFGLQVPLGDYLAKVTQKN